MTKRGAVALVVAAVGLAACGGTAKTVTVREPATATAATSTKTTASQPTQTRTTTPAKTGSTGPVQCGPVLKHFDVLPTLCVTPNGAYNEVATDNHAIHIPGMTVQFNGARTVTSLSDSSGVASAHANGVFLIISLRITNTSNTPQTVETPGTNSFALTPISSQAIYTESFQAENGADQQSFITQNNAPVQAGESQTGDVVFDVPPSAMTTMRHDGAVLEWGGFGTDVSSVTGTASSPIGLMIIYHRDLQN